MSLLTDELRGLGRDIADRLAEWISRSPEIRANVEQHARVWLNSPDHGRMIAARMARSEVKNYMAEICEEAGVPFTSPAGFIAMSRDQFLNLVGKGESDEQATGSS